MQGAFSGCLKPGKQNKYNMWREVHMKLTKRLLGLLMVLMLLMTAAGCGGGDEPKKDSGEKPAVPDKAEKIFLNIATGGTSGVYYPLGGTMAEILTKNIPNVTATAQTSGASVANVNMLAAGDVQLAFVQNDIAYYADNGTEMFADKKVAGLKCLATIYPETCQVVTLKSSGITSIADLKGKKVAVGAAGSGAEANARQILAAHGITYEDIDPQYLSFSEAANGLKDGNIEAAFLTAGHPTAAIQDISAQHEVVLLPIEGEVADKLLKEYPFYAKVTIPAETYPKQTADVNTIGVKAMLIATDKMEDQMAYDIVKAVYTNLDQMKAAHAVGALISAKTAQEGVSIPMHPGASKYFEEKK